MTSQRVGGESKRARHIELKLGSLPFPKIHSRATGSISDWSSKSENVLNHSPSTNHSAIGVRLGLAHLYITVYQILPSRLVHDYSVSSRKRTCDVFECLDNATRTVYKTNQTERTTASKRAPITLTPRTETVGPEPFEATNSVTLDQHQ
jgi:hypothetical protein